MSNVTPLRPLEPTDLRTLPSNVAAERALLGAILLNNKTLDQVLDFLKPEMFADPAAERVYAAVVKLIENGTTASVVTLAPFMSGDEVLIAAGGVKYLAGLSSPLATASAVRDYGHQVLDLYLRRQIIQTCQDSIEDAYRIEVDSPAQQIMERTEEDFFAIAAATERTDRLASIEAAGGIALDLAQAAHKRDGALAGVTTGLKDLDRLLGGMHSSDLLFLAGRVSMGKTSLAVTTAYSAARHFQTTARPDHAGKQVAFFSLEMSGEQLAGRVLAHLAGVNAHSIREGRLTNDEMMRLAEASLQFGGVPFQIDDTPGATVNMIRTRCRRIARAKGSKGLGLVVIDHLHLMEGSREDKGQGRRVELATITRGLKKLAKDLNVPVLCLCQMNRKSEDREDKRPQLADLQEAGAIEQDADAVIFVFREQYYLERSEPTQRPEESDQRFHERHNKWQERCSKAHNIMEIILGKQRHGPIGFVRAHFNPETTWVSDLIHGPSSSSYTPGGD